MLVYDYYLEGSTKDEIIFNAHNCHPYQANDDISGCAVTNKNFSVFEAICKSVVLLRSYPNSSRIIWTNVLERKVLTKAHTSQRLYFCLSR